MDALGRYVAIILAVILIFLFPLQYIAQSQGEAMDDMVSTSASKFTDNARNQGVITLEMYEDLISNLSLTGDIYDISLEVAHPVSGREVSSYGPGDSVPDLKMLKVSSDTHEKDNETVTSFSVTDNEIYSFAEHTHTDECYEGHRHDESCEEMGGNRDVPVSARFYKSGVRYSDTGSHPSDHDMYVVDLQCKLCQKSPVSICYYDYLFDDGSSYCGNNSDFISAYDWSYDISTGSVNRTVNTYRRYLTSPTQKPGYIYYNSGYGQGYYIQNPECETWMEELDLFYAYINGAGLMKNTTTITDYLDGFDYDGEIPFIGTYPGCYSCVYTGPEIELEASSYSYYDSDNSSVYYSTYIKHKPSSCDGYYGQTIFSFAFKDGPNDWYYSDSYFSGNNSIGYSIFMYNGEGVSSGGSGTVPYYLFSETYLGEGWTKILYGTHQGCYQKINPEYERLYNYYRNIVLSDGQINMDILEELGYKPEYSCQYCIASGKYPKVKNFTRLCGETEDVTPICDRVVTSITATNSTQAIGKGGSIITTAVATYLDGHTGTVNCTSNFNANLVGTQTVTLTHSGLVGNAKTTGTRTCTSIVTVRETNLPASLTITPSSNIVYNGAEPTYTVRVNYTSGSNKIITSGYTKSGFTAGPGTKIVTFQYTENEKTVSASINITVKPNLSSITVSPSSQQVERYKTPSFTVTARYEDGSTKQVTGYTQTGFNGSILGIQNVTILYEENSITRTAGASVTVTPVKKVCPVCGTIYELDDFDNDNGCPACSSTVAGIIVSPDEVEVFMGSALPVTVEAVYRSGGKAVVTGWTSNFNSGIAGLQEVTISYQSFKTYITVNVMERVRICPFCGNGYDLSVDGSDPGCPSCREEVVSISASPEHVTIEKHQPLNLTVTATYRDGHSGQVTGWSSDLLADRSGTFDVTVSYKKATDHIIVTILEEGRIQCPYCGLDYIYREHPQGCPKCYNTIIGIEASLRNGGTRIPYKSNLNLQIAIIYRDTHRSLTYSGWTVDGFQPDSLGIQTITVWYQGFSTLLTIEVTINPLQVTCPYGHIYYLNSDGTDLGCPHCVIENSIDNAILLFDTTYKEEILESLYEDGIYCLKAGDYLTVTVIKTESSVRSKIGSMFLGIGPYERKYTFGGEVI